MLIRVVRPRRSRSAADYSRQTFPWTIYRSVGRSVGRSVCPVHCGKTADRIRMPFRVIGRTSPGMRQVVRFGHRRTGRVLSGAHLGRAIVTNGDFTAYVCDSAPTVGAAVWGGACGRPRHCCTRCGVNVVQPKGGFWAVLFSIFTMGNDIGSPTVNFVSPNVIQWANAKDLVYKLAERVEINPIMYRGSNRKSMAASSCVRFPPHFHFRFGRKWF